MVKVAGMGALGVQQIVQISRMKILRTKSYLVCFLYKKAFRFQILSTLLCFNTKCLLEEAKLNFPEGCSVLQILVHNNSKGL